jgi:hypothetical protein
MDVTRLAGHYAAGGYVAPSPGNYSEIEFYAANASLHAVYPGFTVWTDQACRIIIGYPTAGQKITTAIGGQTLTDPTPTGGGGDTTGAGSSFFITGRNNSAVPISLQATIEIPSPGGEIVPVPVLWRSQANTSVIFRPSQTGVGIAVWTAFLYHLIMETS